jgi:ABC-type xylose transport system permease subunit
MFFAAISVGGLAARGGIGRVAAILLGLWIAWDGWQIALRALAIAS